MSDSSQTLIRADERIAAAEKVRFFTRAVSGGKGSILTTPEGEELIDLSSTWTAAGIGYADPRITQAVHETLSDCPGLGLGSLINPQCTAAAAKLLALTDSVGYDDEYDSRRVYFGHSGSDANDIAVRLCRTASTKRGGGQRVLAFEHSYHGGFGRSLEFSGVQVEGGADRDPHVSFLPYPDMTHPHTPAQSDVTQASSKELAYCLDAAQKALASNDVACLIVEAILSDGGMIVPPDGFLSGLRELCDAAGVPMICDEVKVGLGRSGTVHAYQHDHIHPDIVTFGKTLGAGLPISAIVGPSSILDCAPGSSLLTMGGNPACAAAASRFLDILIDDKLANQAQHKGDAATQLLHELVDNLNPSERTHIAEIRGRGLCMAIELRTLADDPVSCERFAEKVCYRANQLGAVVYYVGGHVIEITPALTIDDATLHKGLELLVQSITDVCAGAVRDEDAAGFGGW